MSFPDLCELTDFPELYRDDISLTPTIVELIPRVSFDVYQDLHIIPDTDLIDDGSNDYTIKMHNLKYACMYRILTILEKEGLVDGSSDELVRMGDGDFNVMFQKELDKPISSLPNSFMGWYGYYYRRLLPSLKNHSRVYRVRGGCR